jgi:hypothetical protein
MADSMVRRFLAGVLASLPAVVLGSLICATFEEGAYYTLPCQITAVVFLAASLLLGLCIPGWHGVDQFDSPSVIRKRCFTYPILAWILAVVVLFGLSFTPLVLGQDNGDGSNGYSDCWLFAILSSVADSAIVVPLILLNSFLLASLLGRDAQNRSECAANTPAIDFAHLTRQPDLERSISHSPVASGIGVLMFAGCGLLLLGFVAAFASSLFAIVAVLLMLGVIPVCFMGRKKHD